jgi:hypothetical protein
LTAAARKVAAGRAEAARMKAIKKRKLLRIYHDQWRVGAGWFFDTARD